MVEVEAGGEGDPFGDVLAVLTLIQLYFGGIPPISDSVDLIYYIISDIGIGVEIHQYLYLYELRRLVEFYNEVVDPIRDEDFIDALVSIAVWRAEIIIDVVGGKFECKLFCEELPNHMSKWLFFHVIKVGLLGFMGWLLFWLLLGPIIRYESVKYLHVCHDTHKFIDISLYRCCLAI